jgi:hypothetical protein
MIFRKLFSMGLMVVFILCGAEVCKSGNLDKQSENSDLLRSCDERVCILEKRLNDLNGQFEALEKRNNESTQYEEIKDLKKELKEYEQRLTDISNQLNENMVKRMNWQLTWFLGLSTLLISFFAIVLGYRRRDFEHKAEEISQSSYRNAIQAAQRDMVFLDIYEKPLSVRKDYRWKFLRQMNVETARLRVKFGESSDVIAGANILSRWGVPDIDGPILRDAKKRKWLSAETYETLERAIGDLKKKPK